MVCGSLRLLLFVSNLLKKRLTRLTFSELVLLRGWSLFGRAGRSEAPGVTQPRLTVNLHLRQGSIRA